MAKRTFSQRPNWHRHFHGDVLREEMPLSLAARGLLGGLKNLMFSFAGPIKNDLTWIGKMLGLRDKRTVAKALQELIDMGYIEVTDEGLNHQTTMRELDANSALFASYGPTGGRPAKEEGENEFADSSRTDDELIEDCSQSPMSQPIEIIEDLKKPEAIKEQSQNQTTSVGSKTEVAPSMPVGGGGSDVQKIIEEFFRIAGCIWGPDVAAKERINTSKNAGRATEWLRLADGSVGLVLQLIEPALTKYASDNGCPGTLGAIYRSMPGMITSALAAPRSTNGSGKSPSYAGPSRTGGNDVWTEICSIARQNWHDDVVKEIRRRAEEISDEEANRFAESMRSYVSTKKAMAAA